MFRALLEGLCFEYALGLQYINELFPDIGLSAIDGTGGGSKNALWNQMKANVLNLTYNQLGESQFALRGCAILAGYSLGIYTDMEKTAGKMNAANTTTAFIPKKKDVQSYKSYFQIFKQTFTSSVDETMGKLYRAAVH